MIEKLGLSAKNQVFHWKTQFFSEKRIFFFDRKTRFLIKKPSFFHWEPRFIGEKHFFQIWLINPVFWLARNLFFQLINSVSRRQTRFAIKKNRVLGCPRHKTGSLGRKPQFLKFGWKNLVWRKTRYFDRKNTRNQFDMYSFVSQSWCVFWQKNDMLLKWSIVKSTSEPKPQRKAYHLKDTSLLCDY